MMRATTKPMSHVGRYLEARSTRRLPIGFALIFIATFVACACAALGENQAREAPQTASPSPVVAEDSELAEAGQSLLLEEIDPPAQPGSTSPALAAEHVSTLRRKDDVLMTWLEPGDTGGRLRFARFAEKTWSQPITIANNVSTLAPVDRPSLTVLDTQAVRRTLVARTGDIVARSGDAGRTWTRLPTPALPFASFAGGEEGGYAFWLTPDVNGAAKLLGTRILAGETLLDPVAADGSGTSAAMTWDGPVVVYRDGGAEGAQDISMVRRQDGKWTRPRPVHHVAGWHPGNRPKGGPEVAARQRQVAVAWYTEAPHRPRVLVAFSDDAGQSFGSPVEVDVKQGDRVPLPFVDVALDDDGHALILWMATTGPTVANLNLARAASDGRRGEALVVAEALAREPEGIAQIARAGDRVAVTWIAGASGGLRAVTVPLTAIPASGSPSRNLAVVAKEKGSSGAGSSDGRAGDPVLDFELASLDADKVSLASLRGRAVLLNLWATWCIPCIAEMPELSALHESYGDKGLVVVGLSVDSADATARVRAFVAKRELPFTVWLDPAMQVYKALRVKALPATFVIDPEGGIVLRRDGTITADDPELRQTLDRILDGS